MRLKKDPEVVLKEETSPNIVVAAAEFLNPDLFERNDYFACYRFLCDSVPFENPLTIDEFNGHYDEVKAGSHQVMDEMVRRSLPRIIYIANKVFLSYAGELTAYEVFSTVYTDFQYVLWELVARGNIHESPYARHNAALNNLLKVEFGSDSGKWESLPNTEREHIDLEGLQELYKSILTSSPEDPRLEVIYEFLQRSQVGFDDFAILYLHSNVGMSCREIGVFLKRGGAAAINLRLNNMRRRIFELLKWR